MPKSVSGRLEGKTAIIVGAGQTPGDTIGNGKAMALLFAQEGADVLCVDRELDRAVETVQEIKAAGGKAWAFQADVRYADQCAGLVAEGKARLGRIDILVNNVGTGRGDAPPHLVAEDAYDFIMTINLKSAVMTTKAVLPVMREQGSGAILSISSLAAWAGNDKIAYEISKAGMVRHIQAVATGNAKYGVRANVILPGLMDTPMAIVGISTAKGMDPDELRTIRNARVPLGRMGTGWDTAYAALFLCSDEAKFITGVVLPVDGGAGAVVAG
jgi:NAD(P)-dependent dehydrogenase (short-subunit alcohol dehydrogenase family)